MSAANPASLMPLVTRNRVSSYGESRCVRNDGIGSKTEEQAGPLLDGDRLRVEGAAGIGVRLNRIVQMALQRTDAVVDFVLLGGRV